MVKVKEEKAEPEADEPKVETKDVAEAKGKKEKLLGNKQIISSGKVFLRKLTVLFDIKFRLCY